MTSFHIRSIISPGIGYNIYKTIEYKDCFTVVQIEITRGLSVSETVTVANLVIIDNIREVDLSQDECKVIVFRLDTNNCNGTLQPVASFM